MKRREISSSGNIGNDGKLRMYFGELNQFFAMHKGSRIIARFTVASPGSSEALKGYYFNYVVPTFRSGIWEAGERLTDEQTERRLRELSPVIGAAGISAFPMSARVVHKMGLQEDPSNFLLMHAAGANVSGQIASVIAGGLIMSLVRV